MESGNPHSLRTPHGESLLDFLHGCGWDTAIAAPLQNDAGPRRYYRLQRHDSRTAMLMDAIPDGAPGYSPTHRLDRFLALSELLRAQGVRTPEIYGADAKHGFALMEDFGQKSLRVWAQDDKKAAYEGACKAWQGLQSIDIAPFDLSPYRGGLIDQARRRILDWYLPLKCGAPLQPEVEDGFESAWQEIEADLPPCRDSFIHLDFHMDNLMRLPADEGEETPIGILDFQGAMRGPASYDLVNLLEDARYDLPKDLRDDLYAGAVSVIPQAEREAFALWYRVLGTQFHCRVIGQFIQLALTKNNDRYLKHIPRLQAYIIDACDHPVLQPLKRWVEDTDPHLFSGDLSLNDARNLIAADAF